MEPVHVKEVLSLLDRVHPFAIQHAIDPVDTERKLNVLCTFNLRPVSMGEGIINMIEGIAIRSKKQILILIFSLLSVFYNMFMLYWSSRVKSILILNIAYFLTLFIRKCLLVLIEQRKS